MRAVFHRNDPGRDSIDWHEDLVGAEAKAFQKALAKHLP